MSEVAIKSCFEAELLQACPLPENEALVFLIIPKSVSDKLPRRGRTTVQGTINNCPFQATLEPDGQLSHWLKVDAELQQAACVHTGDIVTMEIASMDQEPEPKVPDDLQTALNENPKALIVWQGTTAIARLDRIHWIESAKQSKTRQSRVENGCDMLASGKKRVCCFDQSGFYSKALNSPKYLG